MKNLKKLLTSVVILSCLLACLSGLTLTPAAEAEFTMEIPYGKPTVDGIIEEGEYQVTYVMDKTTAAAWVGDVGSSKVTWHLAWDEGGLYYAGTINDRTPAWRDESTHWVGLDCLELAVNPGLLLEGDVAEGIFFSCGSMENGSVVVYRHNFADGLVSDQITGVNKGHTKNSTSYTMEIYLPWSLVQIDEDCTVGGKEDIHLDSTAWKAEAGAKLGLLPCAIDSLTADGSDIIAYKFNGTDFVVCDFIVATLMAPAGETESETEAPTQADTSAEVPDATELVTDPTDTPADEVTEPVADNTSVPIEDTDGTDGETDAPEKKGCGSSVAVGLTALLIPACVAVLRKRED